MKINRGQSKNHNVSLPLACLNISNTVWPFEVMTCAVNGQDASGSKASCFSIRFVDGVVVDTVAALMDKIG